MLFASSYSSTAAFNTIGSDVSPNCFDFTLLHFATGRRSHATLSTSQRQNQIQSGLDRISFFLFWLCGFAVAGLRTTVCLISRWQHAITEKQHVENNHHFNELYTFYQGYKWTLIKREGRFRGSRTLHNI